MSWRDRLEKASWRGVPFLVNRADTAGGHRLATHQFAEKDGQYAEEIGRKAESYTVAAFLLGADYDKARDTLMAELRRGGSGELVHPYIGRLTVKCENWRLSEDADSGGMASFSLVFVESTDPVYPTATSDLRATVLGSADDMIAEAGTSFLDRYSVKGLADFITNDASAKIGALAEQARDGSSFYFGTADDIADLAVALSDLNENATSLATAPGDALAAIQNSLSLLGRAADNTGAFFSLFGFGDSDDLVPDTTPSRKQQAVNRTAMNDLVRSTALAEAAKQATREDFAAFDDALLLRNTLVDAYDTRAEEGVTDDEYLALQDVRAALYNAVPASDELPRTRLHTPRVTTPSLVVSQRLYGNATKEAEIIDRNPQPYPGFILAGTDLQVLTDA